MTQICVKDKLLIPLKESYLEKKSQNNSVTQLSIGIDTFEVYLKFITIFSISILKNTQVNEYNKIFNTLSNLSLGSYYHALLKFIKVENSNPLFNEIKTLLLENKEKLSLILPSTLLEKNVQYYEFNSLITRNKSTSNIDSIFLYALNFRNNFRGHTSTINEENEEVNQGLFDNLEKLLAYIEERLDSLFHLREIAFYYEEYQSHSEYKKIVYKIEDTIYNLSPIIVYNQCTRYSCKDEKREKLYFINQLSNSKSTYIDYLYNHNFTVETKEDEWGNGTLEKSLKQLHTKLNYSNENKYLELTSIFVGREKELTELKKHILENYHHNTLSIITGGAGIGKSSFVTKLQSSILEENDDMVSYVFYAIKNQNSDNELKYFTTKVKNFLSQNINLAKEKNPKENDSINELNHLFEIVSESNKTLLLIIDGLDELNNAVAFLQNIQLSQIKQSNNIHIVLASRPYTNILTVIKSISSKLDNTFNMYHHQNISKLGYSLELDTLSKAETKSLILELLPREVDINNPQHNQIVNTIVDKSGSLPIYIYYISQDLKYKDVGRYDDYIQRLAELSQTLPPRLEEFYIEKFQEVSTLSRKILITIFFAPYGVSLTELYTILHNNQVDKIAFEQKYFSEIEMFLREVEDNYYHFYHLSVKDAIFDYYITIQDIHTFNEHKYIQSLSNNDR